MQPSHVQIKALIENNPVGAITLPCRVYLAAKRVLGSEQLLKTHPASSFQPISKYRQQQYKGQCVIIKYGRFNVALYTQKVGLEMEGSFLNI